MTRQSRAHLLRGIAVTLALSLAASLAGAATLASVSGANSGLILGPANGNVVVDIQFTLPREYDNVTVAASLMGNSANSVVDAYLTNQVGPGTTAVNVFASNTGLALPNNSQYAMTTLFSGPNLPAGTYHLVFGGTSGTPNLGYTPTPPPAPVTLAPGVTYSYSWNQNGAAFEPASTLSPATQAFNFQITGDPASQLASSYLLAGSAAGSSSVLLNCAGAWTATANDSFLHISAGSASGTGNAAVAFTFDAFAATGSRTGTLTIAGVTFTVIQAGTNYMAPGPPVTLVSAGISNPLALAVDAAGDVFFTDTNNSAAKVWIASTQQIATLVPNLNQPDGIAVDASGNVYIADGPTTIREWIASTQQVVTLVSSGLSYPHGLAVDASGNVYIADSGHNAIQKWNASTQQVTTLVSSGLNYPTGVAVDALGNVYIADFDNDAIQEWNASTQQVTTLVSTGLNYPAGVAVDGFGNVYIADKDYSAIREWSPTTGVVTTLVSTGLNLPGAVAVNALGNIYIADSSNNAIKEIPNFFVGPASFTEPTTASGGFLLPVLLPTTPLTGVFAPSSDQNWLTIGTVANGVVTFSFAANSGSTARTGHISILGQQIAVTQAGQAGSLASQTISFTSLVDKTLGVPSFPLSATASSGLTVAFTSNNSSVCTVSGVNVTLVAAGICSITATQPGDSTHAAATPVTQTFNVTAAVTSYSITGQVTLSGALASLPLSGVAITLTGAAPTVTDASGNFSFTGLAPGGNFTVTPSKNGYTFNPPSTTFTSLAANQTANFGTVPNGSQYAITEYAVPIAGSFPYEIAAGPDGALWFTEDSGSRIGRIAANGVITEYPTPTPASVPGGITAGPDGAMWFTEEAANQIGRITMAGVITEYSGLFANGVAPNGSSLPNGIAAGPDGALWFTEYAENAERIGRITTAGVITEYTGLAGGNRAAPWGIVAGPDGAMWFTEAYGNRIGRITTAGAITEYPLAAGPGAFNTTGPIWIAVGPDGALWFTQQENSQIGRITTSGAITEYAVPTAGSHPNFGIAAGPDGAMWFNEGTANNIGRITTAGVITEYSVPTAGAYPAGIVAGPDGAMWFAEGNGNNIGRIALAGAYGTVNLAASGTVTALTNTVRGDPNSITQLGGYWESYYSGLDGYANACAFTLDLGAVHPIGRIDLLPNQAFGLKVWTSTDGSVWTQRAGYDWPTWMFFGLSITANGAYSARYIKYESYTNWDQYVGINVIQVYEWLASGPPIGAYGATDIALNAPVTAGSADSSSDSSDPTPITDGNPATTWTGHYLPYPNTGSPSYCAGSAAAPYPYCWAYGNAVIDLGQLYPIGRIKVTPTSVQGYALYLAKNASDTAPQAYAVASSPGLWTTFNYEADPTTFYFNGTAQARYVVVLPINVTPGDPVFPSLNEVQVYAWSPLSVASTHTGSFTQGQTGATYTVTVQNVAGTGPTSGAVTVTETLPSGLTLVSMVGTGWDCSAAPSCTRSDVLADGASYPPITVTVNVTGNATTPQVNQVSVSGGGSAPASASDSTVVIGGPALSATKTHTGSFTQGQNGVTYTIAVSNGSLGGPTTGTVTVTDSPTSGLTPVSMSGSGWTCDSNFGVGCTRSDVLAPGASYPAITVTMNVAANAMSPQINQAIVAGGGLLNPVLTGDMATITSVPVLSIGSAHTGSFTQGQSGATYTVTVSNAASAGPASGAVTVTESAPSGLTLVSMTGTGWDCSAAPSCARSDALAGGASYPPIVVTVNVASNAASPLVNSVGVSGGGSATASATDSTIVNLSPVLSIVKTHTGSFIQGQNGATYTATVSNAASAAATSGTVTVSELPPSGETLVSMAGTGWTCASGATTCTRSDSLAPGASYAPITVTVNVAGNAASPQVNTAGVSGGGSAPAGASDSTTIVGNPPVLSITSAHTGSFTQGQSGAAYTVTVSNTAGVATSSMAAVTDTLPSGLILVSMSGTGWTCPAGGNVCHRIDPLAVGSSYPPITVTVNVAANAASPQVNAVSVSLQGTVVASSNDSTIVTGTAVLGSNSILVGSAAGSSSVILTTTGSWTAAANSSFLHVAAPSVGGTGNAVVVFTYDAFTGTGTRTGTLTIAGLTLTVTQAGTNYVGPGGVVTLVSSGLNDPLGVAVDGSGNVYIADYGDNTIYKWSASTQQVTTLVSSGLYDPFGVAADGSGNVYIADTNDMIMEWNASTQQLTTLVSSGLKGPTGVAVDDSGNVYIADSGNQAIKEWSASTHQVTTLVPPWGEFPFGVAVDVLGNLYTLDAIQQVEEWSVSTHQVTTLPSTLASNSPTASFGVAVDGSGNVYIADSDNQAIKEWSAATQQVTTAVSGLYDPWGVAVDGSGDLYISDAKSNAIKEAPYAFVGPASLTEAAPAGSDSLLPVLPSTQSLTGVYAPTSDQSWLTIGTIANGIVNFSFTANTTGSARTAHISILGQQVAVTQSAAGSLTAQTIAFGALSDQPLGVAAFTVSATASSGLAVTFTSTTTPVCTVTGSTVTVLTLGSCSITASQAGNTTYAAATPVTRSFNVSTTCTYALSPSAASFAAPGGTGIVNVTTQAVCPWTPSSNQSWLTVTSASPGTGNGSVNYSVAANSSTPRSAALTIGGQTFNVTQLAPYLVSTIAGGVFPATPIPGNSVTIPASYGMATDPAGNLYLAAWNWNAAFKLDTAGILTRVAGGSPIPGFSGDGGPALDAQLSSPMAVTADASGNVYIADTSNCLIRKVTPLGVISTVAGSVNCGNSGDSGPATSAQLSMPYGMAVDASGNLYIADSGNSNVRMVAPNGTITTVAGNGTWGFTGDNGSATSAELANPYGVAVDASGNL